MTPYKNLDGDSGIKLYSYGPDWIFVQFTTGRIYKYHSSKIGSSHVLEMIRLAETGRGLNEYINRNDAVKNGYSSVQ